MSDFLELLKDPALGGGVAIVTAAAAVIGGYGTWFISRVKMKSDISENKRHDNLSERTTAFAEIITVIGTLRADIADLRTELEQERVLRRTAEKTVRALMEEVSLLRKLLQSAGISLPPSVILASGSD